MTPNNKVIKAVLTSFVLVISTSVHASYNEDGAVYENRYVMKKIGIEESQTDVFKSILTVDIPDSVETISDAIHYLVSAYGYRLSQEGGINDAQYVLLMQRLPISQRHFDAVTLKEILSTVGGDAFSLYINPVSRLVSYQLKAEYSHYVTPLEIKESKDEWLFRYSMKESATEETKSAESVSYGPVKEGESLSRIVQRLRLKNLSFDQALVILFHANPHAFNNENMNHLIIGATLKIPLYDNEFIHSQLEATVIVDEHYNRWVSKESQ